MKKKSIIFVIIGFFQIFITVWAQSDRAMFVHRNDGEISTFLCSEIDSIKHNSASNGADGLEAGMIYQEIYSADSVFRIPINVIDSITFEQSATVYSENVVKLREQDLKFITYADSSEISFSRDIPSELGLKKGDILLYEGFNNLFPNGYARRVMSVTSNKVMCEDAEFEDVYERLIIIGNFDVEEDPATGLYRAVHATEKPDYNEIFGNLPISVDLGETLKIRGEIDVSIRIGLVAKFEKGETPYVKLFYADTESFSLNIDADSERSSKEGELADLFSIPIVIPSAPAVRVKLSGTFSYNVGLSGSLTGFEVTSSGNTTVAFRGVKCEEYVSERTKEVNYGNITVSGSAFIGLKTKVSLGTVWDFADLEFSTSVGPVLSGNLSLDLVNGVNSKSAYTLLKDTRVDCSLRAEAEAEFKFILSKLNNWETPKIAIGPGLEWPLFSLYVLPEFSGMSADAFYANWVNVAYTVSRRILTPVQIGVRLYDENKNEFDKKYVSINFPILHDFNDSLHQVTFEGLKYASKYRAVPIVKVLGIEVECPEEIEFECPIEVEMRNVETSETYAWCYGKVILNNEDGSSITDQNLECGFIYNTSGNPSYGNGEKITASLDSSGLFTARIDNLQSGTQYYCVAFIKNGNDFYYSDIMPFETEASIVGKWTCVWYTTPPNAQLQQMTLNYDNTMSQTYYYEHTGNTATYYSTYSYDGRTLTFFKDNGDVQDWKVVKLDAHNLTITAASNGFNYYFKR